MNGVPRPGRFRKTLLGFLHKRLRLRRASALCEMPQQKRHDNSDNDSSGEIIGAGGKKAEAEEGKDEPTLCAIESLKVGLKKVPQCY